MSVFVPDMGQARHEMFVKHRCTALKSDNKRCRNWAYHEGPAGSLCEVHHQQLERVQVATPR